MKTVCQILLLSIFLSTGCKLDRVKTNVEDIECGLAENECDLCSDFDTKAPRFIVAVVGDGVEDEKGAMDRKYSVNRAQGEAMWNGVQLAFKHSIYVNEIRGIISLKSFDDGGSPECARRIAECLYHNPCVLAVIGHVTSGTTREAATFYHKAQIPLLMPIATSPSVFYSQEMKGQGSRYEHLFRLPPSDDQFQAYALGLIAIERFKASRVYLLGDVSIDADVYSKPIFEKLDKEILGRRKILSQEVSRNDASSAASNIKQAQPDLVIFSGYWTNFQLILGTLKEKYEDGSKKPRILLSDGCMAKDLDPYGFDVFVTFPAPDANDANLWPTEDMKQLRELVNGQHHQSYEIYGYDALHLLAQAILDSRKEGLSRPSLIKALGSRKEFKGAGFSYQFERGENTKSNYYVFNANTKQFETIAAQDIRNFKSRSKDE